MRNLPLFILGFIFVFSFGNILGKGTNQTASSHLAKVDEATLLAIKNSKICESILVNPIDTTQIPIDSLAKMIVGLGIDPYQVQIIDFKGRTLNDPDLSLPDRLKASIGFFENGFSAGIGLDRGIVLSSGFVNHVFGPNVEQRMSGLLDIPGDADLDAIAQQTNPTFTTKDATLLEFSFMPIEGVDTLIIEFVFGSDEYPDGPDVTFSDVFGFLLNGENIALTSSGDPISVKTVSHLVNGEFYIDNNCHHPVPPCADWPRYCNEMDGFTAVMTVSGAVIHGQLNTIKIAIADVQDRLGDSWVFIRENGLGAPGPKISIEKSANISQFTHVGQEITYTLLVANTGNVNLMDIVVVDDLTGDTFFIPFLRPSATWTSPEIIYSVTQEDFDTSFISNTATVTATSYYVEFNPVIDEDTLVVDVDPTVLNPSVSIVKETLATSYTQVGEEITYSITVTNNGNLTLTDVIVEDPLTGLNTTLPLLSPGQFQNFEVTYAITQANLDTGSVINTATATGQAPDGMSVEDQDEAAVGAVQNPEISVTKTADVSTYNAVGDVITYTIVVANTGNVTLTNVVVQDPLTGLDTVLPVLSPGQSETFIETYIIVQSDIDNGSTVNTATAIGKDPNNEDADGEGEETVNAIQNPGLSLTKTADVSTYNAVGDVITYTIVVTNTGNVTLTEVVVQDPLTGLDTVIPELSPGAFEIFTETYTIVQSDIDNGSTLNTATAIGKDPNDENVEGDGDETVNANQNPDLSLTKTANESTYGAVGDLITYTIVVTNTGNVTLTEVVVQDPLTGLDYTIATIAPGHSQTFTETHTITQQDMDSPSVLNTASASGQPPVGPPISVQDDEIVTNTNQIPELSLQKSASPEMFEAVGDVITYTIRVTNTGNVTIISLNVLDPLTGLDTNIAFLSPGQSESFFETYTITQADMDNGSLLNTATATGVAPNGSTVSAQDDELITTNNQIPQLDITKTANPQTYSVVGEVITYTIVVTNTGNVTLTNITVSDPLTGLNATIASLAPGGSQTYYETYTITEVDLDNGSVFNTASVTGQSPDGGTTEKEITETISAIQNPEILLEKSASPQTYDAAGSVIYYTIVVTNIGNVTISNLVVTDPRLDYLETIPSLSAGQSQTLTVPYTITQSDIEEGSITNLAFVTGADPNGETVESQDEATIIAQRNPGITITKNSSQAGYLDVGEVITFTLVIENTGNVILVNIVVSDPLTGLETIIPSLAPGEQEVITTDYIITQADIDKRTLENVATASGATQYGETVFDSGAALLTAIPCEIVVPGAITPNGDGINDYFDIDCLQFYPNNTILIYNRWGSLVYEASPYLNDWDGVPSRGGIGNESDGRLPSGTYYYVLRLEEEGMKPLIGWVYLLKQ